MSSITTNLASEDLRRVRQELWTNLQDIDTRLKQTYVPPHFRITTSSTNNQRTFSTTNNHQTSSSSNDITPNVKRSRISSSSYDEHNTSLPENNFDESSSSKSLHSSIVPTNKIIKTKDDLISLVNRDQQSTGRNRRMFGVLLGTLNKFKAEANAYNEQTLGIKRHEIERRLDEKQAKEQEDKQHERTELIATKKTCQQKLKLVNIKIELMQRMANHEKIHLPLRNFIRTKTKPYVFYLPKGPIDEVFEKKLQESQIEIDKEIEEFKRDCQQELNLLDDTTNINDDQTTNNNNNNKRKLVEHDNSDDEDVDDDDDGTLADLPDEITFSAPEVKSEIINKTIKSTVEEQSNSTTVPTTTTRTVIYDDLKTSNKQDNQSMVVE